MLDHLEPVHRPLAGPGDVAAASSWVHFLNAFMAFVFAASAPVAIILGVGVAGGLTEPDLAGWIFAAFALNGVLTIVMSLLYRMPLGFFWTIPGTVLIGPALTHLRFDEIVGAYCVSGVVLLLLGVTGSVRRIMAHLPMPIIMGMVAGVFLRFGLKWIDAFRQDIGIALPMTAAYFALGAVPGLQKKVPPMIGALLVGIAALVLHAIGVSPHDAAGAAARSGAIISIPAVHLPTFSWRAVIELVLPLVITVLAAQNAQGIAILQSSGHRAPVSAVTAACGVGSLVTALFGCVSTCLTGPSNAILVSSGARTGHFTAAIFLGLLALVFGVFAPFFTTLLLATPAAFIATLAGLAMLRILQSAFQTSFRERFALGALIAFLVTTADQAIFGIGAPFWGLVFGWLASWLMERGDFAAEAKD